MIGRSFKTDKKIKFKLENLTNEIKKFFELETVSKLSEYNQNNTQDIDIDYINIDINICVILIVFG